MTLHQLSHGSFTLWFAFFIVHLQMTLNKTVTKAYYVRQSCQLSQSVCERVLRECLPQRIINGHMADLLKTCQHMVQQLKKNERC